MKTWESRARSSRMALAPKPSACRLRMSVAMSEPLMDARERRAKGRAAKVFARFFSRATVGFLGRRDLTEVNGPRPRPSWSMPPRCAKRRPHDPSPPRSGAPRPLPWICYRMVQIAAEASPRDFHLPDALTVQAGTLDKCRQGTLFLRNCLTSVSNAMQTCLWWRRICAKCWILLVPGEGVEPTRYLYHRILSPARLPVPPSRRARSITGLSTGQQYWARLSRIIPAP